jgi:3-hydroxyisobutyrate dehydrogenase-like beta-hydroxyacid dehydrogenase
MLLESQHVTAAFTESATGLLTARKSSRKLFIECSTIDVETSIAVSEAVKSSGLGSFVDAPVSGDPNGAKSATLTFMVGGSKQLFEEVFPLLCTMAKKESVFHCGPLGAGLATKQINNYLLGVIMIGVSEAMDMGIRFGLDPQILSSVINVSSGNCYNSLDQNPVKGVTTTSAVTKDFEGGFSMELCKGVLEMAIKLEKDVGPRSILSSVVASALERVSQSEKCKGKDCREASTNGLPI